MGAKLTLRECAPGATCSLAVGASVLIGREGISLGTPQAHQALRQQQRDMPVTVDVSARAFTRGPWTIAPIGTGHRLLVPEAATARINGIDVIGRSVVLRPGDRLSPGVGVVFEYEADAPVVFDIVGPWLLINAGRLRC